MKKTLCACAASIALLSGASLAADAGHQISLETPGRPEEDKARDAGRKPLEVLSFFDVNEGETVFDLATGGGYFAELLSQAVGERGLVIAQNPFLFLQFPSVAELLPKRYASGRLKNVVLIMGDYSRLDLDANSVDTLFFFDTYHDIAYDAKSGEAQSERAAGVLAELRRLLKQGGVLAVIDHAANDDMSRSESAKIHRIPEKALRADFERAGFKLVETADFLRNAADDRTKPWFADKSLNDNTDRFIHRYVSPD